VLHDGDAPSSEMKIFLEGYEPTSAFIVGGTAAVPASIEAALVSVGLGVTRLAGANRFETAVAIAEFLKAAACIPSPNCNGSDPDYADGVILANGRNFPDALAAAPLSEAGGQYPILLTEPNSIPAATAAWHLANSDTLQRVWVVGGPAAVSNAVLNGAVGAATAVRPVVTSATTANAPRQAKIEIEDYVTLTATTALPGAAGNDWTVDLVQVNDVDIVTPLLAVGDKTITVVHNFNVLTAGQFVSFWNANGGNTYFTAVVGDGGTGELLSGSPLFSVNQGIIYSLTAEVDGIPGGTDVTIIVNYSRPVDLTVGFPGIAGNALWEEGFLPYTGTAVTDVLLEIGFGAATANSVTVSPSGLVVILKYSVEDSKLVPVAGETSLRILPGAMALKATPYSDAKAKVTSPSQQVVLTAAS
jgi:hypothetical protein